jgi:GAF domain-containing protein
MSDARELLAIREIAHAFLLAEHPGDVQQFALDRITPLLGASFSLVMQLGVDGELLRPVAQHEWPAPYRSWIGALRVRVGDGPSGVAVAERRLVEVVDLFEEPSLVGWHEVARELGFRSIMAAPLETADGPIGALAFYFADATTVTDEQRALVRLVADQLAAATDNGSTVIVATHELSFVHTVQRVIALRDGRLVYDGLTEGIDVARLVRTEDPAGEHDGEVK